VDHLTPSQRGAVAEAGFGMAALQLGLTVLRPICEGRRYDLVLDLNPKLLRIQCKLARRSGGVLVIGLKTNRCTPGGYVSSSYAATEVDAIGAYSPDLQRSFLIPISEASGRRALHLRLDPPKNNQSEGIRWARDYELASRLARWQPSIASPPTVRG
jgi:hypothetical protein